MPGSPRPDVLAQAAARIPGHRDEIGDVWDLSVFLEVPFAVTARRMAYRDGSDPDPAGAGLRRYVEAQRIYFAAGAPQRRADLLIDNADLGTPRILRG